MALSATLDGNTLTITIDTNDLRKPLPPSASGKTRIVATTSGNVTTELEVNGQPVVIGLNAYIKNA